MATSCSASARKRSASSSSRSSERKSASSWSAAHAAASSADPASGDREPWGWFQNRPSSAVWTSVPFTVHTVAGSGRRSMAVNRNASAQSRNDDTLDGDSDRGGSKGTSRDYGRGVSPGDPRARMIDAATRSG